MADSAGYISDTEIYYEAGKQGCFVAGVETTVAATRSAAFGLDGNTNVQSNVGELCVFGDFRVTGATNLVGSVTVDLSALLDGLGT